VAENGRLLLPAVAAAVVVSLQLVAAVPPNAAVQTQTATTIQPAPGVVIAEVLFDPPAGARPFVELLNAGPTPANLSRMLIRVGDTGVLLGRVSEPLAVGARLVVRFDGESRFEPGVLHTAVDARFAVSSGTVALGNEVGDVVDRVAWGPAPGAVSFGAAGVSLDRLAPGSTIGRPPGAVRAFHPLDWTSYAPEQATPGSANPLLAVTALLPSSGAMIAASTLDLSWYEVAGAASYRVQVATDQNFAAPRVDQIVSEPAFRSGPLAPGQYHWRVQARPAEGPAAAFSETAVVQLYAPSAASNTQIPVLFRSTLTRPQAPAPSPLPLPDVMVPVPMIVQHKDTRMLQLENAMELGPHAWNVDHGTISIGDPADIGNCLLASIAMINRRYNGNLSQDRLGYEALGPNAVRHLPTLTAAGHSVTQSMLEEQQAGPEWDFVYGRSLSVKRALAALTFALGAAPGLETVFNDPQAMWNAVTAELEAGRPALLFTGHALVVKGYGVAANGHRILWVNNPWRGPETIDVTVAPWPAYATWIFMPAQPAGQRQEATVTQDADTDGVVDFDEVERFRTVANKADSDDDGVEDLQDIRSGVFEIRHRYGYAWNPSTPSRGRDYDDDGVPTERDADSDNDGCRDGVEDENGDGKYTNGETDNFDEFDGWCESLSGQVSWRVVMEHTIDGQTTYENASGLVRVKLRASDGPGKFEDDGSSYSYRRTSHLTIAVPGCAIFSRVDEVGAGDFRGDGRSIGAAIGEREPPPNAGRGGRGAPPKVEFEMALGASGPGRGQGTTDSCVFGGQGEMSASFTLPYCTGLQDPQNPRRFVFACHEQGLSPGPGVLILQRSVSGSVTLP
jgi:hypothetical protein